MGLVKRSKPRDTSALYAALTHGTLDELKNAYEPPWVNYEYESGTPLETIAAKFTFSDVDLTPFYDVLLARPDLDLLQPGLSGRPVLVNLRTWSAKRGELVIRAEQTLTDRGVPVPPRAQ